VFAFPCVLLVVLSALERFGDVTREIKTDRRFLAEASMTYFTFAIPFYALLGYYASRLEWCLTVPLILLIGFKLSRLRTGWVSTAAGLAAAVYIGFWVMTLGPFS
jgi:hypothetical protein